jgi:hypothetical protein
MIETLSVELVIIVEKKTTPTPRCCCCCCTEKAVATQGVLSLKLASKQQKKP